MSPDCKKALSRIAKLCRTNIAAFGPAYDPRSRPWQENSAPLKGAKAEGVGVADMAREVLTDIRLIRREIKRGEKETKGLGLLKKT